MSRNINTVLAKNVSTRANDRCEYCGISISDTYFGGEIDHILSIKHGGETTFENLALACQPCNRKKGTDLGSVLADSRKLIRFFDPRTDVWSEHFTINSNAEIETLSDIGKVTADIFGFNDPERIDERIGLIEIGHYKT